MSGLANAELFVEWKTGTVMCLADTVSSDFQGAGASSAKGLVPNPGNSGTTNRYLNETGIWKQISSGEIANLITLFGNISTLNASLAVSVSSSNAIVNVYTIDGSVPTTINPVYLIFKASTTNVGGYSVVSVNTSLSLTIPAGATLGAITGTAFRIWILAQNPIGSSVELGTIRPLSGLSIFRIKNRLADVFAFASMNTASDAAQTAYSNNGQTGMFNILGYFTYESGLAAAGEWTAAPSDVVLAKLGQPFPGDIITEFGTVSGSANGGSTLMVYDNTTPEITEGTEFITTLALFGSRANIMEIESQAHLSITASTSGNMIMALFQDTTTNALASTTIQRGGTVGTTVLNYLDPARIQFWAQVNVAKNTATTFRIRAGAGFSVGAVTASNASAVYGFNCIVSNTVSFATGAFFNNTLNSYIYVREFMT